MKTYAQAIGLQENNEKENGKEPKKNGSQSTNTTSISKRDKQEETINSMKEVISILKQQVNQLMDMIKIISQTIIHDEEKRNEILNKMNQINAINLDSDNTGDEITINNNINTTVIKRNKEIVKRKGRNSQTAEIYRFNRDNESSGRIKFLNQQYVEESIEKISTKRSRRNNDNK